MKAGLPLRVHRLRLLLVAGLLIVGARLLALQLLQGEEFLRQAEANMLREIPIPAPRGFIYDRQGRVLARNVARFHITLVPGELENPTRAVLRVAGLVGMEAGRAREILRQMSQNPADPVVLKEILDPVTLARVAEVQADYRGIYLEALPMREYPWGELAGHVLGHLGEVDEETLERRAAQGYFRGERVGKDGLELAYERFLRGRPGRRLVQVDAAGQPVRRLETVSPRPGDDLYLNLDVALQETAEAHLGRTLQQLEARNGQRSGGAVVALDPESGRVRVLASLPAYDPNWYSRGISRSRFDRLIKDPAAPLLSRAVLGTYPPGSTFKIITASAALAEGVVPAFFYCGGGEPIGDTVFHCFVRSGHGTLDLENALAHSCDVAFYQLGTRLGVGRLGRYAAEFGIGRPTGIDLPGEAAGILPDPAWKRRQVGEGWYAGDDANLAIGQGFLLVSPLQMAVATAAVANGGSVWRPFLVDRLVEPAGTERILSPRLLRRLPVPPSALQKVRAGMRAAVLRGTGSRAWLPDLEILGKTGTVENLPTEDNPRGLNHTWFTSFAYYKGQGLVVTVFLEKSGGYGGELAAPIAREVFRAWKRDLDGLPPTPAPTPSLAPAAGGAPTGTPRPRPQAPPEARPAPPEPVEELVLPESLPPAPEPPREILEEEVLEPEPSPVEAPPQPAEELPPPAPPDYPTASPSAPEPEPQVPPP